MNKELKLIQEKLEREQAARKQAEQLLEKKSFELDRSNQKLQNLNANLKNRISEGIEILRKTDQEYELLVESINEMVFRLDIKGKINFVNQTTSKILGIKHADIIGQSFFDVVKSDEIRRAFYYIGRQYLKKNCISYLELPIKTIAKKIVWMHLNIQFSNEQCRNCPQKQAFLVGKGTTLAANKYCEFKEIIIVGHDITQRKKNELEIARNLKQQEILSQIALIYNSQKEFETKTRDAIQILGEYTGVSRVYIFEDSFDGKTTNNTFEWCNVNIESHLKKYQNTPYSTFPSIKKILIKDGMIFSEKIEDLPADIYKIVQPQGIKTLIMFPLIAHGNYFGFIGYDDFNAERQWTKYEIELLRTTTNIISNAIQRKKIQEELISSEKENRIIIDSIPDAILRINNLGKIKSFKSAKRFELFSKLTNQEDDNIYAVFDEKLANSFLSSIKNCLRKGKFNLEFKHLTWNNLEHYEARFVKLNKREVLTIVRDVTAIKENERQLKIAKNKAEQASKSKSEFLANVSHEIRTPMNAILGFSQWLLENTNDNQHKEYLRTILTSGRNLLSLINDILDLSKIESGKMDIDMQPMLLNEVLNDIKQVFKQKTDSKGISLNVSIKTDVPPYIYMDELRFYQIIFNLVGNAVKFTSKGYVHISAYANETGEKDEIDLMVSVEDTGIGIEENHQKDIFESFTQQSGQSNRNYEGTGLGLAIVRGLLTKLNGSIKLKSEVGKGSNFTVTFSNVKVDRTVLKEEDIPGDGAELKLDPCTIMIVDDIEFNILVLKNLINSENVRFIEAHDGSEALSRLQDIKPDLIFMDIRMPGLSGFDVTEIIKEEDKYKNIPVVAFTASTLKEKNDQIDKTFDAYLQKPVFKKDVNSILKKFLNYHYEDERIEEKNKSEEVIEISKEYLKLLPKIIQELEVTYIPFWKNIKDNLVIYEIESFKNQLEVFALKNQCIFLTQYSKELNIGLQSFDIELIGKKLSEFPKLIEKLKSYI
ncbi:MAG: response regulator [Prolixibacteraceae bacterium]|nr:response regulator [Prolixibacteraceae bacterium]